MYVDVYGFPIIDACNMWQRIEKYYYDETDLKSALTRGVLKKGDLPQSNVQTVVVYKDKSEEVNLEISRMNPIVLWGALRKDDDKSKEGGNPTYNYTYLTNGVPYGGYPQQQFYPNMAPHGTFLTDIGYYQPHNGQAGYPNYVPPGQPPQIPNHEDLDSKKLASNLL